MLCATQREEWHVLSKKRFVLEAEETQQSSVGCRSVTHNGVAQVEGVPQGADHKVT